MWGHIRQGLARHAYLLGIFIFILVIGACSSGGGDGGSQNGGGSIGGGGGDNGGGGTGGGNDGGSVVPSPSLDTSVNGTVVKGIIKNATVDVFAIDSGAVGTEPVATTTTDDHGNYTFALPTDFSGPVVIIVHDNGNPDNPSTLTCDVVTGCGSGIGFGDDMPLGDVELKATVANITGGADQTAAITPFTLMAAAYAEQLPGGLTAENIATANSKVGNMLGVNNIVTTIPPDITDAAAADSSFNETKYAYLNAAIASLAESDYDGDIKQVMDTLTSNYSGNDGELIGVESTNDNAIISLSEIASHAWWQAGLNNSDGQVQNALDNLNTIAQVSEDQPTDTMPSPTVGLGDLEVVKAFVADTRTWGNVINQEIQNSNASQFQQKVDMAGITFDTAAPVLTDAFNYGMTAAFEAYMTGPTADTNLASYFLPTDPVTASGNITVTNYAASTTVAVYGVINGISTQFTIDAPLPDNGNLVGDTFELSVTDLNLMGNDAAITGGTGTVTVVYAETTDLTSWLNDPSLVAFPDPDMGNLDISNVAITELTSTDPISYSGSIQVQIVGSKGSQGSETVIKDSLGNVVQYNPAHIDFTGSISNSVNDITGHIAATMVNAHTFMPTQGLQSGDVTPDLGSYGFSADGNTLTIRVPGLTRIIAYDSNTQMIAATEAYDGTPPWVNTFGTYLSLEEYLNSRQPYVSYIEIHVPGEAYYHVPFPTTWNLQGGMLDGTVVWGDTVPDETPANFRELSDILVSFNAQLDGLPEALFEITGNRTGYDAGNGTVTIAYGGQRIELQADYANGDTTGTVDITNQDGVVITYERSDTATNGVINYNGQKYADIETVNGITIIRYIDGYFDSL
ncbi:MAG: hypothetical protein PVJ39_09535 [Gammaproteobacteria bacterium]|jgi:hypothetical protein